MHKINLNQKVSIKRLVQICDDYKCVSFSFVSKKDDNMEFVPCCKLWFEKRKWRYFGDEEQNFYLIPIVEQNRIQNNSWGKQ